MQTWLALFPGLIKRRIDFFETPILRVCNYLRPGFVSFAQRNCVSMARTAVSTERFIRNFCDVWATHHDWHSNCADGIRHTVSSGCHSGHGADPDEPDTLIEDKLNEFLFTHRARVSINQQNFVTRRRERLQEKHPKVRHEVSRHTVVRVIQ